jgi:hypothetical protein
MDEEENSFEIQEIFMVLHDYEEQVSGFQFLSRGPTKLRYRNNKPILRERRVRQRAAPFRCPMNDFTADVYALHAHSTVVRKVHKHLQ